MLSISIEFPPEAKALLDRIEYQMKYTAMDKAMKALARPVNAAAKPLMPDSIQTGTRLKWSRKYKDNPKWQISSGKLLASKVKKTETGALLYVGPKYDEGNKQKFNAPTRKGDSRVHYLWGKPGQSYIRQSKRTRPHTVTRVRGPMTLTFPFKDRAMQRAWDTTKDQALNAFVASLKQSLE